MHLAGPCTKDMFHFHDPGRLADGDLELVLYERYWGAPSTGRVPAYRFQMTLAGGGPVVGVINLRVGTTEDIVLYAGHIGYAVQPDRRGHHYAARACRLLLPLARLYRLDPLWITCNPDNWASRRTCELAGAVLVEIVDLPPGHELTQRGDRQKCRYRLDLP